MEIIDYNGLKLYKWQMGSSSFILNPTLGARLMNWNIAMADGSFRDVIYWPENAAMGEGFGVVRGGNPILFPFAGLSTTNGENFKWKSPQGDILDMPLHGFAKDATFELVDINDYGFSARLIQDEFTAKMYPYKYEFYVNYRFSAFSFAVELKLENKDSVDIPWCAGNHFYFRVPWHDKLSKEDYMLKINAKNSYKYQNDGSLEKVDSLKEFALSRDDQINVLHTNLRSRDIYFGPKNGEENISLKVLGGEKLDKNTTIVTWCEDIECPYYCVEAWQGLANAQEHGKGLHLLKPKKSESFLVEVSL